MRRLVLIALMVAAMTEAQAAKEPDKAINQIEKIEVLANGDAIRQFRAETKILNPGAITVSSSQVFDSVAGWSEIESLKGYVVKADGSEVAAGQIETMTRPADSKTWRPDTVKKVIHFPPLEVGDTTVVEVTRLEKALFPGHFMFTRLAQEMLDVGNHIEITVPEAMTLTIDAPGYEVRQSKSDDRTTYVFEHEGGKSPSLPARYVTLIDREPRVFASSFKSYDELAAAYAGALADKIVVTPAIKSTADEITAVISDRHDQARALFDWVRDNIRTADPGEATGGGLPMQTAETTLSRLRGDTFDRVVLYVALLKAEGIPAHVALVNGYKSSFVPKAALLSPLQHAVAWLPEFNLYADPSSIALHFDVVATTLSGRPALRIGAPNALDKVPVIGPEQNAVVTETAMVLDDKGIISGTMKVTGHGSMALGLRAFALSQLAQSPDGLAERFLVANGMPAATGSFVFPPPGPAQTDFSFTGSFQDHNGVTGRSFAMPRALTAPRMDSGSVLGAIAEPRNRNVDPIGCNPGHAVEDYSLSFPAGQKLVKLPADRNYKSRNINYVAHWSLTGNTVHVRHELMAKFDGPLCTGSQRSDVIAALDAIIESMKQEIAFAPAGG